MMKQKRLYRVGERQTIAMGINVVLCLYLLLLLGACQTMGANASNGARSRAGTTHLYVVTQNEGGQKGRNLFALDFDTGRVIWRQTLASTVYGYGVALPNMLYLPASDGTVYAFGGRDGQMRWKTALPTVMKGELDSELLTYGKMVIESVTNASNGNGDLYALNAQSGQRIWHTALTCTSSIPNACLAGRSVYVKDGVIYGLTGDGLAAWNADDGHLRWRNASVQLNGQPQAMVVTQGKIYISNFYPKVDVVDTRSGRLVDTITPGSGESVVYDIAANEKTVYVLGGHSVTAYRVSDDALLWRHAFGYHSGGTIVVGDSSLYVNYQDISMGKYEAGKKGNAGGNNVYALSVDDGQQLWHSQPDDDEDGVYPVEADGVICLSGMNSVYGLESGSGMQRWRVTQGEVQGMFGG